MCQFVNGPQFLLDVSTQLEGVQTCLLRLQSGQRLGLTCSAGLHPIEWGPCCLINPTQARPHPHLAQQLHRGLKQV
jgi:hypothetical protein